MSKIWFDVEAGYTSADGEKNCKYCNSATCSEQAWQMYNECKGYPYRLLEIVVEHATHNERFVLISEGV